MLDDVEIEIPDGVMTLSDWCLLWGPIVSAEQERRLAAGARRRRAELRRRLPAAFSAKPDSLPGDDKSCVIVIPPRPAVRLKVNRRALARGYVIVREVDGRTLDDAVEIKDMRDLAALLDATTETQR